MRRKYYQIRERAESCESVGVIKVENGVFPLERIKEAIESHLDENIEVVGCCYYGCWNESIVIEIKREDGETDFF